jgi:hypothetical protein
MWANVMHQHSGRGLHYSVIFFWSRACKAVPDVESLRLKSKSPAIIGGHVFFERG